MATDAKQNMAPLPMADATASDRSDEMRMKRKADSGRLAWTDQLRDLPSLSCGDGGGGGLSRQMVPLRVESDHQQWGRSNPPQTRSTGQVSTSDLVSFCRSLTCLSPLRPSGPPSPRLPLPHQPPPCPIRGRPASTT